MCFIINFVLTSIRADALLKYMYGSGSALVAVNEGDGNKQRMILAFMSALFS